MAWFSTRRVNIKRLVIKSTSIVTAFVLGGGSVMAILPAASAYAIDQPSSATIGVAPGATIYNTSLVSGTVNDADGVSSVSVQFLSNGVTPVSPVIQAVLAGGNWSVQLTKDGTTVSPSLTDPSVDIRVSVTDNLSNVTDFTFTPYSLVIPETELFASVISTVSVLDPSECLVTKALQDNGQVTVFGPNNEALQAIPVGELASLQANPDELCAVLATHILAGPVASTDITGEVQVQPENPDNLPLTVEPKEGTVAVNAESKVVNADNSVNGASLLHVINMLIQPRSQSVDINDVTTNLTSPALSGTVADPTYVVTVRVNGQSYSATNNGDGTWTIPAGVVNLDPKASNTLFSIVAREPGVPTPQNPAGLYLVGITLRSNVLRYVAPGAGSGSSASSSASTTLVSAVSSIVSAATNANETFAQTDTSEPAQGEATPAVQEDNQSSQDNKNDSLAKTDSSNQWYWWVIGIATLGALYYILGGSAAPTTKK